MVVDVSLLSFKMELRGFHFRLELYPVCSDVNNKSIEIQHHVLT